MAQPAMNADRPVLQGAIGGYIVEDEDPYSAALAVVVTALEVGLHSTVADRMSDVERQNLVSIAVSALGADPAVRIDVATKGEQE